MSSFVVRNVSADKLANGGTVIVYGAGFSHALKAWFDESPAVILDYDETELSVTAPENPGIYSLYIGTEYSDRISAGRVEVVQDVSCKRIILPPTHSPEEVRDAMLGLLPRGIAWYKGADGVFARLMYGLAFVVAMLYERMASLVLESSPTHTEMFEEWERELSLPEPGVDIGNEVARRREIYRKACRNGGCTLRYFKSIAALYGIEADIYEYWKDPGEFSGLSTEVNRPGLYWMFRMRSGVPTVTIMRCGDDADCSGNARAGNRIRSWGNPDFSSFIEKIKPAHTVCLYAYPRQGA